MKMEHVLKMVGKKFGRLTVIERAGSSTRGNSLWLCHCDCGMVKPVAGVKLRNKTTKSCGCLRRDRGYENSGNLSRTGSRPWVPREQAVKTRFIAKYKNQAKLRGLPWMVTNAEFESLMDKPCHYCVGLPEGRRLKHRKTYDILICNGVDRVDNSLGYLPSNVVPCCKICQRAKLDLPLQEFLDYLNRVRGLPASRDTLNSCSESTMTQ